MSSEKENQEPSTSSQVPFDEIRTMLEQVTELGLEEVDIKKGDFRLHIIGKRPQKTVQNMISTGGEVNLGSPVQAVAPAAPAPVAEAAPAPKDDDSHLKKVTSPMVGTFYRSPAPDAPSFVKVGDQVSDDSVLCIVEAMKLMNEIKAEMSGKIAKIYVENGQPVEYGQPIFGIEED